MIFLPILIFGVGIVTCVYSNTIPAGGYDANLCPPPESIAPCTCFKLPYLKGLTALCANFTDAYEIKTIFDKNPNWKPQSLWIDNSVMKYIPKVMLEEPQYEILNVSSTSLITLFDKPPVSSPKLTFYLTDVKIQRGFEWKSIANATLLALKMKNMEIKSFGQEFKVNIPKGVEFLWFENTGVINIKDQAFSDLSKLVYLVMNKGNLKKVSRDMFPKPWIVKRLELSDQKIADLPEDFFTDMPGLQYFYFRRNLLTTISENIFTIHGARYVFNGNPIECNCNIKWITEKLNRKELFGTCAEPKSLKGTRLSNLTADNFAYCQ